jgi:hypothetical protein
VVDSFSSVSSDDVSSDLFRKRGALMSLLSEVIAQVEENNVDYRRRKEGTMCGDFNS